MQQGVTIIRPGQRLIMPGVRVMQTRASGGGWWDNSGAIAGCVAAYAPKGAASLAASYINLANPGTNNAAPGVAPTWDVTGGWTFNGSTQHLTTGVVPTNNQTYSIICRFSNLTSSGFGTLAGVSWILNQGFIIANNGSVRYYYNGSFISISNVSSAGVVAVAGNKGFYNGSAETGTISSSGTANTYPIYIGGINNAGTAGFYVPAKIQAIAFYSRALTSGEVSTLTTLMNAL